MQCYIHPNISSKFIVLVNILIATSCALFSILENKGKLSI